MSSSSSSRQRHPTAASTPELLATSAPTTQASSASQPTLHKPRPPSTPPPAHVIKAANIARRKHICKLVFISLILLAATLSLIYLAWNALPNTKASSTTRSTVVGDEKASTTNGPSKSSQKPKYKPLDDADTNAHANAYESAGPIADANSAWFAYSTPSSDELLWKRYVSWHTAQLHYHASCSASTEFIVWSGTAVSIVDHHLT
jgi:hypothetical protein